MTKFELAKKTLEGIGEESFYCCLYASEGGACGDGWSGDDELYLSSEEILYLLKERIKNEELFEGIKTKAVNIEERIEELAEEGSWPDGADEDCDYYSYGGECESLETYLDAWEYIITNILSGDITEDNLDSWLEYFDDSENYETYISDWFEYKEE